MNQHFPGDPEALAMSFDLSARELDDIIKGASIADLFGEVRLPSHPERVGNYQYTHTGNIFFALDPRPEEIFIRDIAAHTSRLARFGGATKTEMSVAEHLYIASFIGPEETALERLMHDGAEAYIGDMIRPLKSLPILGSIYLKIEAGIERAIADRFLLDYPWPKDVKFADEAMIGAEIAQNIASKANPNHIYDAAAREAGVKTPLYYWSSALAEKMFMARFNELWIRRNGSAWVHG